MLNNILTSRIMGIMLATGIIAVGIGIYSSQQDIYYFKYRSNAASVSNLADPSGVYFQDTDVNPYETDYYDNSHSLETSAANGMLQQLSSVSHHRLLVFIDSTDGTTFQGKVSRLQEVCEQRNVSLLSINFGPNDVNLFVAPDISPTVTDAMAAGMIRDTIKPALAAGQLSYAVESTIQQFGKALTGQNLISDKSLAVNKLILSTPGGQLALDHNPGLGFTYYVNQLERQLSILIGTLVGLSVLAGYIVWRTTTRYWGLLFGLAIGFAGYQALSTSAHTSQLISPSQIVTPVLLWTLIGGAVGFFLDYLVSLPSRS